MNLNFSTNKFPLSDTRRVPGSFDEQLGTGVHGSQPAQEQKGQNDHSDGRQAAATQRQDAEQDPGEEGEGCQQQ